jgi:putative nucleotidyltransferase with HDIG domain
MLVHFVTDEPSKIQAVRAFLEPEYIVAPRLLGSGATPVITNGVLMVDADLREPGPVEQIKLLVGGLRSVTEKLFVVQQHLHHMVAQAFALGATAVVSRPREIVAKLAEIEIAAKVTHTGDAETSPDTPTAAAFASMFSAIRAGKPFTISDAVRATSEIIEGIEQRGLGVWLDNVRRYHQGTFQHCLLVTGVAIGFAIEIRFHRQDVNRLGLAATLHDIGKARIPLTILDKPGRLDPREEDVMRRHPVIGYELLQPVTGISPEVLDAVRHHHEYLDGSGYPDGLTAPQISDLVRLLTISDIYAALIEARSYRPPMSQEAAYKTLCEMDGKLEGSLVKAFRNVASQS